MANFKNGFAPSFSPDPILELLQAVLSCDLELVEDFVTRFENNLEELLLLMGMLGSRLNSAEIRITGRKFSWRQRGVVRCGVVVEFNLIRANRILLIPTEPEFPSVVLDHQPGTVGTVCADCPKLMMRQIGKLVGLPTFVVPPPLWGASVHAFVGG